MTGHRFKIIFLFSGQGSHYRQMGHELFKLDTCFRQSLDQAKRVVESVYEVDLLEEVFVSNEKKFDNVLVTHPAIVSIQVAMCNMLASRGIIPDAVVGTSLGEFPAAVAAGFWSSEEAILCSAIQAKAVSEYSEKGGMLAILHQQDDNLLEMLDAYNLFIACENFTQNFVVAGRAADVNAFQAKIQSQGITCRRLEVDYPFHTGFVDPSKHIFLGNVATGQLLKKSNMPKLFSSLTLSTIEQNIDPVYFWDAIAQPFAVHKIVNVLESLLGPCLYIDVGPSGTMATLFKYNLRNSHSKCVTLLSPFNGVRKRLDELDQLLQYKVLQK